MKKILLLVVVSLILTFSCSENNPADSTDPNSIPAVTSDAFFSEYQMRIFNRTNTKSGHNEPEQNGKVRIEKIGNDSCRFVKLSGDLPFCDSSVHPSLCAYWEFRYGEIQSEWDPDPIPTIFIYIGSNYSFGFHNDDGVIIGRFRAIGSMYENQDVADIILTQ